MSDDFGISHDFETVRDGLEKTRSASAADEALAALDRIEARLRKAQEGREYFLGENAKLINERNRGWHNHEIPAGLTSHSHTQGAYAHIRELEAERDRLEAEREEWKAGTFPGWTADHVYKDLADKYREVEEERDNAESHRRAAEAERDAAEAIRQTLEEAFLALEAERDRLRRLLDQITGDSSYTDEVIALLDEVDRLRRALERVIEELHETSGLSGLRRRLDFEQKATNAAIIAHQVLEGDADA